MKNATSALYRFFLSPLISLWRERSPTTAWSALRVAVTAFPTVTPGKESKFEGVPVPFRSSLMAVSSKNILEEALNSYSWIPRTISKTQVPNAQDPYLLDGWGLACKRSMRCPSSHDPSTSTPLWLRWRDDSGADCRPRYH